MPYYGKIARLPRSIRDELNHRLDNNEPGVRLVAWLNGLPEVRKVLDTDFEGREISEQNLSEWKANGYLDWQGQQQALAATQELKANARELAADSAGELTESLATVVAARYAIALRGWNGEMTDEMRSKLRGLRGVTREVARLRRGGQLLERMKIQREWLALGSKASALRQRCYEDSKRSDEERALSVCLDDARKYPEVVKAFRQTFGALRKAKAAK